MFGQNQKGLKAWGLSHSTILEKKLIMGELIVDRKIDTKQKSQTLLQRTVQNLWWEYKKKRFEKYGNVRERQRGTDITQI